MAIFPSFEPEEWIFFPFIFGSLLVYAGSISAYSDFFVAKGAGQIFNLPVDHIVVPLANSGSALLALFGAIAFVWYFGKVSEILTPGFVAAIIFGAIAIMLGV